MSARSMRLFDLAIKSKNLVAMLVVSLALLACQKSPPAPVFQATDITGASFARDFELLFQRKCCIRCGEGWAVQAEVEIDRSARLLERSLERAQDLQGKVERKGAFRQGLSGNRFNDLIEADRDHHGRSAFN